MKSGKKVFEGFEKPHINLSVIKRMVDLKPKNINFSSSKFGKICHAR